MKMMFSCDKTTGISAVSNFPAVCHESGGIILSQKTLMANFNWLTLKFTFLIKIFYSTSDDDFSFLRNPSFILVPAAEVSLRAHLARFLA